MEQLRHHFEMGYSPNNATMVVTGDVSPEEIFQLCEKYIEPIPTHAPPPPVVTVEPEQLGERRFVAGNPAPIPLGVVAEPLPPRKTPHHYRQHSLSAAL